MTVFYRKYRPQKFADLVGQDRIKETLLAQLTSGKISHGYLFSGPRGTGKTSTARIFAKALNCRQYAKQPKQNRYGEPCNKCESCLAVSEGSHLDLIEIDGASNRGIDEIRDLREKIKLSPISSKFKVYIIDEAHMLTTEAFNALLKTLEEPPQHAIFILCTTAPSKLPATIISRLTRINFSRASMEDLVLDLQKIAKVEGLDVEREAFDEIAKIADGSFRDAESLLDQLAASGRKISAGRVKEVGGGSGWTQILSLAQSFADDDLKKAVLSIEKFVSGSGDISFLVRELVSFFEKLLLVKLGAEDEAFSDMDKSQKADAIRLSDKFNYADLQNIMKQLLVAESEIRIYPLPKIPLILAVCRICSEPQDGVPVGIKDVDARQGNELVEKAENVEVEAKAHSLKNARGRKGKIKSLDEVEASWNKFLESVRKVNAHLVALLRSTRPVDVSSDILTIEVFYRFHKDKLEEPKITAMLEGFMEDIFKTKVGLKFVLAEKRNTAPQVVKESDVVDVSGDDLTSLAQEIFSK